MLQISIANVCNKITSLRFSYIRLVYHTDHFFVLARGGVNTLLHRREGARRFFRAFCGVSLRLAYAANDFLNLSRNRRELLQRLNSGADRLYINLDCKISN